MLGRMLFKLLIKADAVTDRLLARDLGYFSLIKVFYLLRLLILSLQIEELEPRL
jgi:hypothetical protein